MKRRLLILTSHMGFGHLSAANSLKSEFENRDWEVRVLDPFKENSRLIHDITRKIHNTYMDYSPIIWAKIYSFLDNKDRLEYLKILDTAKNRKILTKVLLTDFVPDAILATHPMWNLLIRKILDEKQIKIPLLAVITDSISIHRFWSAGNPDYYLTTNLDSSKVVESWGEPLKKIKDFGFPVATKYDSYEKRKNFWSENYGLSDKKKTLLLTFSSSMPAKIIQLLIEFSKNRIKDNYQLVIVTGDREDFKKKLLAQNLNLDLKILGWCDNMAELISEADIIVCKAGGATIMEAIAAKKRILVTHFFPGQEEGNLELVKKYGIGVELSKYGDFAKALEALEKLSVDTEKFKQISKPKATLDIVNFVSSLN